MALTKRSFIKNLHLEEEKRNGSYIGLYIVYNFDWLINVLSSRRSIFPLGFLGILFTNRTPPLKRFCEDTCSITTKIKVLKNQIKCFL